MANSAVSKMRLREVYLTDEKTIYSLSYNCRVDYGISLGVLMPCALNILEFADLLSRRIISLCFWVIGRMRNLAKVFLMSGSSRLGIKLFKSPGE